MKNVFRKIGIGLGILGGLLILGAMGMYQKSSHELNRTYELAPESIVVPTDEQSIANGKVWVTAICAGCHGADLAGTTMVDDPALGRVDSANLTAGVGGVGSTYTDADWVRAIRHGVGPNGKPLMIMPSSAFWNFSDQDLGEVIAYIKTIPAVDHETKIELSPLGTTILPTMPFILHVKLIDHNSRPAEYPVGVTSEYGNYLINVRRLPWMSRRQFIWQASRQWQARHAQPHAWRRIAILVGGGVYPNHPHWHCAQRTCPQSRNALEGIQRLLRRGTDRHLFISAIPAQTPCK